jgi:hypothetical protein
VSKADIELSVVRALFAANPDLRQGRWIPSPDPDVDVLAWRGDGGVIAIEVTRLHPSGGQQARKWEGAHARILAKAKKLCAKRGLLAIEVVVFWSNWVDPTPHQRRTATALADFVLNHLPRRGDAIAFDSAAANTIELRRAVGAIELRRFL